LRAGGDMRQSFDLIFASSNKNKYNEARQILEPFGIRLKFYNFSPTEIQSNQIHKIAAKKALDAYAKCRKPVIVEDVGLFVEDLGGFPGPYSSYVYKTIGNNGIIRLIKKNRDAKFLSVIAYCHKKRLLTFEGVTNGSIATKPKGGGWGYDPIFVPQGRKKTYGQISDKNQISHRYKALANFARWYKRQSSDQRTSAGSVKPRF
jgi:XTP/dITP diphosphohydrolase